MDLYKQSVDEWLEETPYSALRILEKLRKMDLNEKAAVRFEIMPGEQGQMDWGFFEDHLVYEDGIWLPHWALWRRSTASPPAT